jgi:hypothetical protein
MLHLIDNNFLSRRAQLLRRSLYVCRVKFFENVIATRCFIGFAISD